MSENDADADGLVVRAKTEREALGKLYDRYYPSVYRYCVRRLVSRAAAEDVVSEVFLRVASSIDRFAGSTDADFRCWVFRIATNAVNASLRQSLRRGRLLRDAEPMLRAKAALANEHGADVAEDWPVVAETILELDLVSQSVITLRFVLGMSHDEIGAVVEKNAGAVRTILSRALAKLRERFANADVARGIEPRAAAPERGPKS